jgi:hypothetical protein
LVEGGNRQKRVDACEAKEMRAALFILIDFCGLDWEQIMFWVDVDGAMYMV